MWAKTFPNNSLENLLPAYLHWRNMQKDLHGKGKGQGWGNGLGQYRNSIYDMNKSKGHNGQRDEYS